MPGFTFNPKSRSFAGPDGKTVLHTAIRAALDSALDTATTKARADGDAFAAGTINAPEYATRIHAALKSAVTMAVATAAGGWQQTTALDWSQAARFTKARYAEFESLLTKYHRDEATGPQLATWAAQLIQGGRSAYEAIRRRLDLAAGMTRERRVLGDVATVHCAECEDQAAMGWQDAGVLLPIGSCTCRDRCLCSFQRE